MWQDNITIIIPTSLASYHPSDHIIMAAIASLNSKMGCEAVKKIIIADPPLRQSDAFDKYLPKLQNAILLDQKLGLPGAIRHGIAMVKTPIIFVFQHDFIIKQAVDLRPLVGILLSENDVKYIRFNRRSNCIRGVDRWLEARTIDRLELTATLPGWSDNPHLATLKAYKTIYLPLAATKSASADGIERHITRHIRRDMQQLGEHKAHEKYGTYLYGPINHPRIIKHHG